MLASVPKRISSLLALLFVAFVPLLAWAGPAAEAPAEPAAEPLGTGYEDWTAQVKLMLSDDAVQLGSQALLAVLLFIGGWFVARLISYGVFVLLGRTDLDNRLAQRLGITMLLRDRGGDDGSTVERFVAKVVYYVLMLLVVVGVLQFAGLSQVAEPIAGLVNAVLAALPKVGKAALILLAAYFAGLILRKIVGGALDRVGVDRRFAELTEDKGTDVAFSETAGTVVFWLLMVFGLAGAFDALEITPLADPLHNAIDRVVALLPAIAIAALIAGGGYVLGRVAKTVVKNLLASLGFDKLAARVGLDKVTGRSTVSEVVGIVVMVFIILQAVIAALGELGLETLSGPLTAMVGQFWELLPSLAVAGLIVAAGVFIGGLARRLLGGVLRNVGFDRLMQRLGFGKLAERTDRLGEYSEIVAFVAQFAIVFVAVAQALDNLSLDTWSGYIDEFLGYAVKHVAVAIVVVGIGFAVGNYVRDLIKARDADGTAATAEQGTHWLGEFARYAVLVFAFTMAVRQLDVAEDFVLMTFGLLFGGLCLAMALAFGLGGRDVAGEIVRRRVDQARSRLGRGGPPRPPGA